MYVHYKGLCKRHSSYSVLHHSFYSLNETFLIPQASAVHAAVCLTSEPLMHTDAVHQLLEPSQGVSSSLHSVQWLFEKNLLLVIQIKNKAATSNPFFITKAVFIFLFWAYFIIKFLLQKHFLLRFFYNYN